MFDLFLLLCYPHRDQMESVRKFQLTRPHVDALKAVSCSASCQRAESCLITGSVRLHLVLQNKT